ncbi:MAG TPA: Tol-Pal system beta propeller repeat protein TolB [Caulobacteraceae bacterium]|nr:Tol-Pal system beta propeller repeat protein TolB [Caulobacteraceae bacterium]
MTLGSIGRAVPGRAWARLIGVLVALCLVGAGHRANADITINVDQGVSAPLPIAIPDISGASVGSQIAQVVSADLARSELFKPLDPASFPAPSPDVNVQPAFPPWKAIGAQALLTGEVVGDADGRLRVAFRLWDVYAGQQLLGEQMSSAPENWRRIAHKIADAVYEKLTGQPGYFDTRVVFVAESGDKLHPIRRLAIMDQDGANPSYLTNGATLVFTPRFSANSQEITFMSLRPNGSSLHLLNIETGREERLGSFSGMAFAPRFSPDGRKVVFSIDKGGNSDVYVMDLSSHSIRRLTTDPAIDTSPCFSPDGRQIVFNSDRAGTPELYVMDSDGGGLRRLSFGDGKYTEPVWSPDGKFIAFTRQEGDTFHIGVMRPDGSGERLLTSSFLDEGPTWAPNSRVIMFSRKDRGGRSHLWTVDISGRPAQPAPYPLPASDAAWSPLLN